MKGEIQFWGQTHTTIAKSKSWIRPYSSLKFHLKYALWEAPICLCFRYGDIENLIFCSCCMVKCSGDSQASNKSQKFSELDIGGREIYSTLNFIKK